MKTIKLFLFLITILSLQFIEAQKFTVDGINYNNIGYGFVEVIGKTPAYAGSITIPATVSYNTSVYNVAQLGVGPYSPFSNCIGLTSITLPTSLTTIGYQAFINCTSLISVNLPNNFQSIGSSAFSNCTALSTITIPNSVITIGGGAFESCTALSTINIPNSVTDLGNGVFYNCINLTSINIPNSITTIQAYTFYKCTSLTSVNIPNSVTAIGAGVFSSSGLTSINIPNTVTILGNDAFSYCTALTSVTVNWNSPLNPSPYTFAGVSLNNVKLNVPCGKKSDYQAASVWSGFNPIEEQCALGLIENSQNPKTEFFPNPAIDKIIFTEAVKSLEIYTATGQKLKISNTDKEADISSLPKGTYVLKITTESGEQFSKKMIKE